MTADDSRVFGYEPVQFTGGEPEERWLLAVEATIPAIRALVERHERLLDLWRLQADAGLESHWQRRVAVVGGLAAAVSAATLLAARQGQARNGSRRARLSR